MQRSLDSHDLSDLWDRLDDLLRNAFIRIRGPSWIWGMRMVSRRGEPWHTTRQDDSQLI